MYCIFAGVLLPYPDTGVTLGIEIFVIFLLAFFEGVRLFLGRYGGGVKTKREGI